MVGPGQQPRIQRDWTHMNGGVASAYRNDRILLRWNDGVIAAEPAGPAHKA
jgi:hypothetical protein